MWPLIHRWGTVAAGGAALALGACAVDLGIEAMRWFACEDDRDCVSPHRCLPDATFGKVCALPELDLSPGPSPDPSPGPDGGPSPEPASPDTPAPSAEPSPLSEPDPDAAPSPEAGPDAEQDVATPAPDAEPAGNECGFVPDCPEEIGFACVEGVCRRKDDDGVVEVYVEPGKFWFGCVGPVKGAECEEQDSPGRPEETFVPFAIDQFEVTVERYKTCIQCIKPNGVECHYTKDAVNDSLPMNCVTRQMALDFCVTFKKKSLCREFWWEKAARGPEGSELAKAPWPWGNTEPTPGVHATWNTETAVPSGSHPEGASPRGVLDMADGVSEWADGCWKQISMVTEMEPTGFCLDPSIGVLRGGSFSNQGEALRVSNRQWRDETDIGALENVGFRCCRDLTEEFAALRE